MRRDLPTTPFDVEADDLTQQFWGAGTSWQSSEQPTVRRRGGQHAGDPPTRRGPGRPLAGRDDTTGSLRVIREGFAAFRPQTAASPTGEITRRRRHGEPGRPATPTEPTELRRREASLGELASGRIDVGDRDRHEIDAEYHVPLTPVPPLNARLGLGAVDPLLVRAGALLLALILLVPIVLSLRPDRDDSLPGDVVEAPQQVVAGAAPTATTAPAASATDQAAATGPASADEQPSTTSASTAATPEVMAASGSVTAGDEPSPAIVPADTGEATGGALADDGDAAAQVDILAERVVPACTQTYTAAAGDSWYRIADAAAIAPSELLAENNATTDTVILPGDDICLPAGAAMPSPPTTAPPAESDAPTTTDAPTTSAPATTVAPVVNLSRDEVQELIRATWPADEVETALAVARRESNFVATADNGWCCVGVFQIYWTVHDEWLDDFGIHQRSDLFDARKNVAAAYAMWQRSGWGPWGG